MSYEVQYSEYAAIKVPVGTKKKLPVKKIAVICAVVLVVSLLMIPSAREALIPGNAQVTKEAAGEMIHRIRAGEGVVDAFAQFCLEIIENS